MNGTLNGLVTGILISSFVDNDGKTVDYAKISVLGDKGETSMSVGLDLALAKERFSTEAQQNQWKHKDVVLSGYWNFYYDKETNQGVWKFKCTEIAFQK
jgi:hypothetical protein